MELYSNALFLKDPHYAYFENALDQLVFKNSVLLTAFLADRAGYRYDQVEVFFLLYSSVCTFPKFVFLFPMNFHCDRVKKIILSASADNPLFQTVYQRNQDPGSSTSMFILIPRAIYFCFSKLVAPIDTMGRIRLNQLELLISSKKNIAHSMRIYMDVHNSVYQQVFHVLESQTLVSTH